MNPRERGFLLLCSRLGDPERKCLAPAQLRMLANRVRQVELPREARELELRDLTALGYGSAMARRILELLSQEDLLEHYLRRARHQGCHALTRASEGYPGALRQCLGGDSPGCLWYRGDLSLLEAPKVALVGSRELRRENAAFAREAGRQAARQGRVLVSGNARGADREAQNACLAAGGWVICVVADELERHEPGPKELYLAEESFDEPFSAQRALSRNRVIHSLAPLTLVAQCQRDTGGTWDGTTRNLRGQWSRVCCFDDGSDGAMALADLGAQRITLGELADLQALAWREKTLFDLE